jgi:ectoine hydroxylase-related dioxygenase (phytanoyl-CoA dioxygenase family)
VTAIHQQKSEPGYRLKTAKPFREIKAGDANGIVLSSADLRAEMDAHGYAIIRGLLCQKDLNPLLGDITGVLHHAGWFRSDSDPFDRIANSGAACFEDDSAFKAVYDQIFSLPSFHALPHHPVLQQLMKMLVGPYLLIHPKSVGRLIFPNFERAITPAHQDHAAIAGDEQTFTAWLPLHDCPLEQGVLRVLDGSHKFGLQPTVGQTGCIPPGTERGGEWVGGEIYAGDLLLFNSLTVHEAAPNTSNRMRISLDCRFQSYQRTIHPAALVLAGSGRRSWETIYANWPSGELKYYWARLPLQLKPSKSELAELAQTSASPAERARYAGILEAIESPTYSIRPKRAPSTAEAGRDNKAKASQLAAAAD